MVNAQTRAVDKAVEFYDVLTATMDTCTIRRGTRPAVH